MRAIILAAGIGSRLRPMTDDKPKTLVEVNGKPMLKYIIDSLQENGINDIVVCTGFKSKMIVNFCKSEYPNIEFKFVNNKDYELTNNLYTLYLANEFLNEQCLIMNADIVFDSVIIEKLVSTPSSRICIDTEQYIEESMKVVVRQDGTIKNISKKILEKDSFGCSIDIYKFLLDDVVILREKLIEVIEIDNHINEWTESLLDLLMSEKKILVRPLNIRGAKWYEIDNYDDLFEAEKLFNPYLKQLSDKKTFILDMDGTIFLGNSLIEGSKEFINGLIREGKKIYIMTNNSSKVPSYYQNKINNVGINSEIEVISSLDLAIKYFHDKGVKRLYWIANSEVDIYLKENGFEYDDNCPQALLLTYDTEVNYRKLKQIVSLLNIGIPYYATHTDLVCPTELGYNIPDIGTYIELIDTTTGCRPQKTFGKPHLSGVKYIIDKDGVEMDDIVIIGDRLYTDIQLAAETDMTSILVLSGETNREIYEESLIKADIVVNSIKDLISFITYTSQERMVLI